MGGGAFNFNAVVLPFFDGERWDLFVLFNPRNTFNQNFQKLCPNVLDLVSSIVSASGGGGGGKGGKKKKKKKRVNARLAHISGNDPEEGFPYQLVYR